jgi:flagellar export protein FliJ
MRKKQEESVELEFARRKGELVAIENGIRDIHGTLRNFRKGTGYGAGEFTAVEAVAVDLYISRLESEIRTLERMREEKLTEVNRVMTRLVEARKARKVMEVLRERQWGRYVDESNREETNDLDDINQALALNREKLALVGVTLEEY